MSITAASAQRDITPDLTGYAIMAGFATTNPDPRLATGTYARLHARCLVLREGTQTRVLVSADVSGFPRTWSEGLRASLLSLVGCAPADLVLLASHTHNGPALSSPDPTICYGLDPTELGQLAAYETWLADQVVALVADALGAPQTTVTLDFATTTQSWSYNRASPTYGGVVPASQVETAVPVLCARRSDGVPVAVLYSYGTHPVCAGQQSLWDGDYPAAASATIEACLPAGAVAIYAAGPMGDQDPSGTRGWNLRNKLGAQLGSAVVAATAGTVRPVGFPTTATSETAVPLDLTAGITAMRAVYVARAGAPPTPYEGRHAQEMIAAIDAGGYPTTVAVGVTVWKLSGTPLLRWGFTAGELISGYAWYYRGLYGGTNGLVLGGHANEVSCYVVGQQFLPSLDSDSYEGGIRSAATSIAAQSMAAYGHVGHFRGGNVAGQSVEPVMVAALTALLA